MKTLILGLGNDIRGDDGLPFYVIDELEKFYQNKNNIDFLKLSEAGFKLIDVFDGYKQVIIIDTIMSKDYKIGSVINYMYPKNIKHNKYFFSHNTGIIKLLEVLKELKLKIPEKIEFLLININNSDLFKTGFSFDYKKSIKKILKIIKFKIRR